MIPQTVPASPCKLFRNYSLNDLSLQQPGSLAVETDLRRQSSVVTDNESLWLSSCYQDAPDEVLTVNYLWENFQTVFSLHINHRVARWIYEREEFLESWGGCRHQRSGWILEGRSLGSKHFQDLSLSNQALFIRLKF